ncbi:MAG: CAP domain-containing protein [Bacillota bacterium]|nr:CAP domain-containing protein [Bacillota bacterium]
MHEDTPLLQQKLEPSSNFSSFTKTAASIIASPLPSGTAKNTANDNFVMQIVELVNAERAAEGLQPLVLDSSLCSAAEIRAEEILKNFSHSRPDGSSCFSALQQAGVVYRRAGENIARGQQNPEEVMKDWMNSPGHRENILNNGYSRIGIALRKANRGYSWAQFFAD